MTFSLIAITNTNKWLDFQKNARIFSKNTEDIKIFVIPRVPEMSRRLNTHFIRNKNVNHAKAMSQNFRVKNVSGESDLLNKERSRERKSNYQTINFHLHSQMTNLRGADVYLFN